MRLLPRMPLVGHWISGAAVALATAAVLWTGLLAGVDRALGDALQRFGSRHPPALPMGVPDVALLALDPQSLRAFPDWPWPRRLYGDAIRRLDAAGAVAIGFDIDFSTPRSHEDDEHFAAAVRESGHVVLAAFRQSQEAAPEVEVEVSSTPIPALRESAAAVGSVLVPLDPDGVVRRAPHTSEIGAEPTPSLAAAVLALAMREREIPVREGDFPVDYRRVNPPFPVLSMVDVVEGRFDPRNVAGRAVFVGATAAEFQDLWSVPLGPAKPGVVIQALAYRTLAAQAGASAVLAPLNHGLHLAAVVLLSLALAPLAGGRHRWRLAGLAAALGSWILGSVALVVGPGVLVSPAAGVLVVLAHYALGLEGVRRRVGRLVAAQDSSLAVLANVGEVTTQPGGGGDLELAIGLLGDVVGASGVTLFRADPAGSLDGRRLDWRPEGRGAAAIGCLRSAEAVLAEGAERVFSGCLPGESDPPARGVAVYRPLVAAKVAIGVLAVECEGRSTLDATARRTVATVAAQLALSAHNLRLLDSLRETFNSSVAALAGAVEARDGYTDLHCRRLAAFSRIMAERLGFSADEARAVELGALLHDVGKIGICDAVLNKPGRFTSEEREHMQEHPLIGARIVGGVLGLSEPTLDCIRHHHEYWDGSGYPAGLCGEEIPIAARIVAVVDVWDALSSARPYKPAYDQRRVLELLDKGRGAQFDPEILDLFLAVLDEQGEEMLAWIERDAGIDVAPLPSGS